ncbi:hypothetical protein PoB_005221500 [Plakobranchus ocellatus]|uniref:Uncharacterized protein n=1 Tax=Plakobranchus ocellatus TaxID=259542 RepID=A0AAV4C2S7_9GAST|nr:hypothetical protein PoB_005221500 [Plakobranchus ocellatus]
MPPGKNLQGDPIRRQEQLGYAPALIHYPAKRYHLADCSELILKASLVTNGFRYNSILIKLPKKWADKSANFYFASAAGDGSRRWQQRKLIIPGNFWFSPAAWPIIPQFMATYNHYLGMLEGKRSRGKQREKLIEGLTDWLKAGKSLEAIEATKDRKKWRTMIANAVKQGT